MFRRPRCKSLFRIGIYLGSVPIFFQYLSKSNEFIHVQCKMNVFFIHRIGTLNERKWSIFLPNDYKSRHKDVNIVFVLFRTNCSCSIYCNFRIENLSFEVPKHIFFRPCTIAPCALHTERPP